MNECKRIITPNSICSESALDAVTKLVATGMKVASACKFVAEEYQKNYPEDKANWETLKKQYQRANIVNKKQGHVPKSEEQIGTCPCLVPEPLVSTELYTTTLDQVDDLKNQLDKALAENTLLNNAIVECVDNERNFMAKINQLESYISKLEGKETATPQPQQDQVLLEDTILTRTDMVECIKLYGKGFQPAILNKDKVTNLELFKVVCNIISTQQENKDKYPCTLPNKILYSTGYESDAEIGKISSLPQQQF